jgi:hypothetical protein
MAQSLTRGELAEIAAIGGLTEVKTMTFAGGTTNDPGDFDGTGNPATLFTVSNGMVAVKVYARVKTALAGATATIAVGTTVASGTIIAQTTATNLAVNEVWNDASPDISAEVDSTLRVVSQNIIQTVGTANITSGVIEYVAVWKPLTPGATLVAA